MWTMLKCSCEFHEALCAITVKDAALSFLLVGQFCIGGRQQLRTLRGNGALTPNKYRNEKL